MIKFAKLIFIVLASVALLGAQQVQNSNIRGFKNRVFNVIDYGATGNGTTDDTAAIKRALVAGAGKVVYFPPGSYKVTSTLAPATGTTIYGGGSTAVQDLSLSPTTIRSSMTNTPLFQVLTDNVRIRDMRLTMTAGVTAVAGGVGIQTKNGIGGGVAAVMELSRLSIVGFYSGIDIDGSAGSTLTDIAITNSTGPALVGRNSQGYWTNIDLVNNAGHGIYLLPTAGTSAGVPPWLSGIQTFNSGGWGIYTTNGITHLDRYYLNNDSLGGLYINSAGSINGIIGKGIIQYAGYNTLSAAVAVTSATNANPIEITTTSAHGLTNGQTVACLRGTGNTAMNGTFVLTYVSTTKYTLNGTTGNGAYTGSGVCGLAAQTYPISPTAPGLKIAATATGVYVDGAVIDASLGNNIDAAGAEVSLRGVETGSAGRGNVVGNTYCLKSIGTGYHIANIRANCSGYLEGTDGKLTGSNFSSITAVPAMQVAAGDRAIIAENSFYSAGLSNALQLDAGVTVQRNQNIVIGGQADSSTSSVYSASIGVRTTAAGLVAQTQSWGICTDCKASSEADNSCVAGGTGAFFFYDPAGAWRCIKTTTTPATATVVLDAQAAAISVGNLYASAPAGTYEASAFLHTTTQSTGACTSNVQIGYTFNGAAKNVNVVAAHNQAVDESSSTGTIATFAVDNATHITRAVDLTAGGGDCTNAVYSVRIVLKRVI